MIKYFFYCLILLLVFQSHIFSQGWVQTLGTPIGGGVTDLLVRQNGDVIATVGSFNWPSIAGGVRKSTDTGQSWQNVASAFNGRTVEEAFDGNLYASIWFFPQNEGLYRSTDGGDTWPGPIYSVPSGDNIFSIALKPGTPNYSIFVGTRNGVIRSTDSGISFQSSNNGIPINSWVRDLEIDSSGIVAAATTNGVFISTDNGDSWNQAGGFAAQDTVVTLAFVYPQANIEGPLITLLAGTDDGFIYQAISTVLYNFFTTVFSRTGNETASFRVLNVLAVVYAIVYLAYYPRFGFGGGVFRSTNDRIAFIEENEGLPADPKTSAISGIVQTRDDGSTGTEEMEMYVGFYENTSDGAKIYKRTFVVDVEEISSDIPGEYFLYQNYPNPFNPTTKIRFDISMPGLVTLKIYDILGREVSVLVDETLSSGVYEYEWNAGSLPSGIYYYKLITGGFEETRKLVLLK